MSRTTKGSKPRGYEFWSRRPGTLNNSKRLTKRLERLEGKKMIRYELERKSEESD